MKRRGRGKLWPDVPVSAPMATVVEGKLSAIANGALATTQTLKRHAGGVGAKAVAVVVGGVLRRR